MMSAPDAAVIISLAALYVVVRLVERKPRFCKPKIKL